VLFVSQEERRASNTVLFTSENNDIANQSVDKSFFTSEKYCMTNQLASLVRRDCFYIDAFWRVNLGTCVIIIIIIIGAAAGCWNHSNVRYTRRACGRKRAQGQYVKGCNVVFIKGLRLKSLYLV